MGEQRRFRDPEPCPALRFGHGDTEPAGIHDRGDERFREASFRVAAAPVVRVKTCAKRIHGGDDFFLR